MELINNTDFLLDSYEYLDRDGMEYALILVRGRFKLESAKDSDSHDWNLVPDEDQGELFDDDIHYDNDPTASICFEKDRVDFKPTTDVIVNGYAYAPEGKPAKSWLAGIKIGTHEKIVKVYGQRYWEKQGDNWTLSDAEPCQKVALRYENAYGGEPSPDSDPKLTQFNPVGKGVFNAKTTEKRRPAHQIEHPDEPIVHINTRYYPQGTGIIHREWQPRKSLKGEVSPYITKEMPPEQGENLRGNQAAPFELMMPKYLRGDETILLANLLEGNERQVIKLPQQLLYFGSISTPDDKYWGYLFLDTVIIDLND
ncbi:MAG TPA: DUF2169 domain-containing protein, partial [Ghiorsea sp.]|nr:DUF2169 domain-containing protein [Ghiorsea sp.]